jgi:hypothetical protein
MTYSTPELLLIGAARNLVLGQQIAGERDNGEPGLSDQLELW